MKRPSPLSKISGTPKGNKNNKPEKTRRSMDTTSPNSLTQRDGTETTGLKLGPGGSEHLGCAPQDAQVNLDVEKKENIVPKCIKSIIGHSPLRL